MKLKQKNGIVPGEKGWRSTRGEEQRDLCRRWKTLDDQ
jgi:hypothetical protein